MSGSIGRQYLLQTWNGASEYSGEMIGNRLKSSTQMYLPNGKANIEAFKEDTCKKGRQKKEEPLEYKLFPQQRTLDNLEKLEAEVERQYFGGEIDEEQYCSAANALDIKKERAWTSLCKAKGWQEELEEIQIRKDIEKLSKQIEKQKEKNERLMQNAMNQRGRQRGKRKESGFPWVFVLAFAFVYCFIL